jgi:putative SOS response-associated peptidase YedK
MCYSALIQQSLKKYRLRLKARVDTGQLELQYERALKDDAYVLRVPKAFEANFSAPENEAEARLKSLIDQLTERRVRSEEQDLFGYKKRLADAERKLAEKPTKTAEKEKAVCERQIERAQARLERFRSPNLVEDDGRIFAKTHAPLLLGDENGERVLRLSRYLLRPFGQPESFDAQFPGCYNARLDNLEGFPWKTEFGKRHGILVLRKFFENVKRHDYERRALAPGEKPENLVVSFVPRGFDDIFVPCLYDVIRDASGAELLHSFALITDEPPPEVAQAGHDRCPIFLKESAIDDWLIPRGKSNEQLYAILGERERPFYEHALAA